ncbi:unnamed protein product [Camellia sinensis]
MKELKAFFFGFGYNGNKKELKALSMLNVYIEGSLPTSLRWLTNLRSLPLYDCELINDVSVIEALENLEILSFQGTEIEELPKEIGRLSHLKLLDLFQFGVKRICPGVLSSLSKLEELYLGYSFDDENRIEETKATFTELYLVLTNLKAFTITIGDVFRTRYYQLQNQLSLKDLHESDLMESKFKNLLKITKILEITRAVGVKNVGYDLDKDSFKKLTELFLEDCQDLEYVIDKTDGVPVPQSLPCVTGAFSALKGLELRDLPALTHLWKGPTQLVRFRNLTSLKLERYDKLESMFSLSIARDLMQPKELRDQNEIASTTDKIVFPKLKELRLEVLPSFTDICKAINGIELLQLNELMLCVIPKLNSIQPLFNKASYDG